MQQCVNVLLYSPQRADLRLAYLLMIVADFSPCQLLLPVFCIFCRLFGVNSSACQIYDTFCFLYSTINFSKNQVCLPHFRVKLQKFNSLPTIRFFFLIFNTFSHLYIKRPRCLGAHFKISGNLLLSFESAILKFSFNNPYGISGKGARFKK